MTKAGKVLALTLTLTGMSSLVAFQTGLFKKTSENTLGANYVTRVDSPTIYTDSIKDKWARPSTIMHSTKSAAPDFSPIFSDHDTMLFFSRRDTGDLYMDSTKLKKIEKDSIKKQRENNTNQNSKGGSK